MGQRILTYLKIIVQLFFIKTTCLLSIPPTDQDKLLRASSVQLKKNTHRLSSRAEGSSNLPYTTNNTLSYVSFAHGLPSNNWSKRRTTNSIQNETQSYEKGCRYFWSEDYDKALLQYKNFVSSKNECNNSVEIRERLFKAYYNMGKIYMNKGDFKQAIQCFLEAKKFPEINNKIQVLTNLGDAYLEEGSYQGALGEYYEALKFSLNDKKNASTLWDKVGKILFFIGSFTDACDAFKISYELDPSVSKKTIEVLDYLYVLYDHLATIDRSGNELIYKGYSENYLLLSELTRREYQSMSSSNGNNQNP